MKKGNNEGSIKKNMNELEEIDEDDDNFCMTNLVEGAVKTPKGVQRDTDTSEYMGETAPAQRYSDTGIHGIRSSNNAQRICICYALRNLC